MNHYDAQCVLLQLACVGLLGKLPPEFALMMLFFVIPVAVWGDVIQPTLVDANPKDYGF